jgi:hypothetical protein
MVQGSLEAVKHASQWLTIAWTAKSDDVNIAAESKEFLKMLVSIAIAALAYVGVKGQLRQRPRGAPVTDTMITGGTVPVPKGRPPIPKAVQIAP